MGIEIRQQGEPELIAKAGEMIGTAQKAEKEQAVAIQREQALAESAERRRIEQVSRDWELQKMILNSQQDFAHEQRLKQADLEAEARAKEWEVQKLELRSQMDFEQEEKERLKNIQAITNQITTLEKFKDQITPEQYTNKAFELQTKLDSIKSGSMKQGMQINQERLPSDGRNIPIINKRKALEAWFGETGSTSSIGEMEQQLRDEGIDPQIIYSGKEITPTISEEMDQFGKNAQGQIIVSHDGGNTWQPYIPISTRPSESPVQEQTKWSIATSYLKNLFKGK